MDYFKLKFTHYIVINLLLFVGINSCKVQKNVKFIDLDIWSKSTQSFFSNECRAYDLLKEGLEPSLSYDKSTFTIVKDYMDYRLTFRKEIQARFSEIEKTRKITSLRIEEFYNNDSESARLIVLTSNIDSTDISIIKRSNGRITIEKVTADTYIDNEYTNDCILANKGVVNTRFSIVTDIDNNLIYSTRFLSMY